MQKMTNTQQAVCALLSSALFGTPLKLPENPDWVEIFRELEFQTVLALPGDLIDRMDMPEEIREKWRRKYMGQVYQGYRNAGEQDALAALFAEHDIAYAVLKGAAAAMYYPKPEYRSMGDVDVVVAQRDYSRALQLLRENGYTEKHAEAGSRERAFEHYGVYFEIHQRFSYGASERDKALDAMIAEGIEVRETHTLNESTYCALPDMENGIVLLEHINQHLEAGLGLRQMVDWMMYVNNRLHDDAWPAFREKAEKIGLCELAVTSARLCQMYLRLPQADITWCRDADEALCAELMAHLLKSGNFGYKDAGSSVAVNALSRSRDGLFRNLQKSGERNWKLLKRCPWLKPFAWLYQICRYARKGLARKNPIQSLKKDLDTSKKLNDMLTRLGATKHGR